MLLVNVFKLAVISKTASLNTFTGKTFEIDIKDQEESSNINLGDGIHTRIV